MLVGKFSDTIEDGLLLPSDLSSRLRRAKLGCRGEASPIVPSVALSSQMLCRLFSPVFRLSEVDHDFLIAFGLIEVYA
jgi:hypothetical protein